MDKKKSEKIKHFFNSILRELSEDRNFEETKNKTRQALKHFELQEINLTKSQKKLETKQAKKEKVNLSKNAALALKVLDDQINKQKQEIKNLDKNEKDGISQSLLG